MIALRLWWLAGRIATVTVLGLRWRAGLFLAASVLLSWIATGEGRVVAMLDHTRLRALVVASVDRLTAQVIPETEAWMLLLLGLWCLGPYGGLLRLNRRAVTTVLGCPG